MKAVLKIYAEDLSGLPIAAVREAIRGFRRGRFGDGHWAPTAAEIRREAEAIVARQERLDRLDRLAAETLAERRRREEQAADRSPEARERVQAMAERFKASVPVEPERGERFPAPVTLSDTLMAQLRGERPIGMGKLGCLPVIRPAETETAA